jgi:hypothetical protein
MKFVSVKTQCLWIVHSIISNVYFWYINETDLFIVYLQKYCIPVLTDTNFMIITCFISYMAYINQFVKTQNRKLNKMSSMDASKPRGWYPYMIRNIAELTLPFNTVSSTYQSLCCHIVIVYTHLIYRVLFLGNNDKISGENICRFIYS